MLAGFFAGGDTNSNSQVATADKLIFATDTTFAKSSANLSTNREGGSGCYSFSAGYFVGGGVPGGESAVADRISFGNDTTTAKTSANLSQARTFLTGCTNISAAGYFAGGGTGGGTEVATADKLAYSTETTAAQASANLTTATYNLGGIGCNSSSAGYFAGGTTTNTPVSVAYKLVFSTDTTATQASANLSAVRYLCSSCSSTTNAYYAGGHSAVGNNLVVTADKLVFSTDTTAAQSSANLSQARDPGACSSSLAGYYAGGNTFDLLVKTADKLVFSNDTTAAKSSANLSQARTSFSGVSGASSGTIAINSSNKIFVIGNNQIVVV